VASSACRVSDYYTNRVGRKVWVVDVGEMQIERPKKSQKRYESGKQKCHTMKSQLLVNWETEIICTAVAQGRTHDFKLPSAVVCRLSHRSCA